MSERPCSPWPDPTSILKHIAYSGPFGEVPNSAESLSHPISALGQSPSSRPRHRDDVDPENKTRIPFVCFLYQSGRHGPQNGFRLLLARPGVRPDIATKSMVDLGEIEYHTAEMVVLLEDDTIRVIADVEDDKDESRRELLDALLECEAVPAIHPKEGEVALQIREEACYPLWNGKKSGPISQDTSTGRGYLFRVVTGTPTSSGCRAVVLVKEGSSPEDVDKGVLRVLSGRRREETCMIVFGAQGIEKIYE